MWTARRSAARTTVAVTTGVLLAAGIAGPGATAVRAGAGWAAPTTLETVGIFSRGPVVVLSADGTRALAVWYDNGSEDAVVRAATATVTGGRGAWAAPVTVSAPSAIRPLDDPAVRMSADGRRVAVAWSRDDGTGLQRIELATGTWGDDGVTWGEPQVVSSPGHDASSPMVGMATDGSRLLVAWRDRAARVTIVARTATVTPAALQWGDAVTVSASTGCRRFLPQADLSADGLTLAVGWEERCGDRRAVIVATGTWPGSGSPDWTAATDLSPQSTESRGPQVAVGTGGTVLVAWRERSPQGRRSVVASLGTVAAEGAAWQRPQQVSSPRAGADMPDLAMSPDGRAAVAAWAQGGIHRGYAWASTARIGAGSVAWQRPRQVSLGGEWTFHPSVAVSDDGRRVGATWYQSGPGRPSVIRYASARVGERTSWSTPVALSAPGESAFLPTIDVCDTGATVIVGWSRDNAEEDYAQDVQVATRSR